MSKEKEVAFNDNGYYSFENTQFFKLEPKEDITAHELAQIFSICLYSISEDLYNQLPDSAKRHLLEIKQ